MGGGEHGGGGGGYGVACRSRSGVRYIVSIKMVRDDGEEIWQEDSFIKGNQFVLLKSNAAGPGSSHAFLSLVEEFMWSPLLTAWPFVMPLAFENACSWLESAMASQCGGGRWEICSAFVVDVEG